MWLLWALYIHLWIEWFVHNLGCIIISVTFLLVEKASLRLHSKGMWGHWSPCIPSQEAESCTLVLCSPFPLSLSFSPGPQSMGKCFHVHRGASCLHWASVSWVTLNPFRLMIMKVIHPSNPTQIQLMQMSSYSLWLFGVCTGRVSKWSPR